MIDGARRRAAIGAARLLDKQTFRGVADRVKQKTGQKGRALFHPIRIALTGAADGPELDLLVPAMDRGADLDPSDAASRPSSARASARSNSPRALDQLTMSLDHDLRSIDHSSMLIYGINAVTEALKAGRVVSLRAGRRKISGCSSC